MSYPTGLQIYNNGSNPPSLVATAYNSPQPDEYVFDELHRRHYLPRGQTEYGQYRQYLGQDGSSLEGITLWPNPSTNYQQQRTLPPQHTYPNPLLYGEPHLTLASDFTSGRPTPRSTPEPSSTYQRATATPKRKPVKKPKEKVKRAALERPLSELTRGYKDIPVRDTEAFVNRPIEERRAEKRPDGSIKRPSNSFMLYRSAYTERCRELEKSKNHQDISSIAGASWAIETPEIKNQFEEWAKMERENHQKAFPTYKFQPQTQAAKERKRKRTTDEQSDDLTDPEDPTYHNGHGDSIAARRSTRAAKNARARYREYSDSPTLPSQDEANTPPEYILPQGTSYFGDVNPAKPPPQAFNRLVQPDYHYVANMSHPNNSVYALPDGGNGLPYFQTDTMGYEEPPPPAGLPGASHDDLMGNLPMHGGHLMFSDPLDPLLTGHDQGEFVKMVVPRSAGSGGFNPGDIVFDNNGDPYTLGDET